VEALDLLRSVKRRKLSLFEVGADGRQGGQEGGGGGKTGSIGLILTSSKQMIGRRRLYS
jgi:hypothetical protein